MQGQRRKTWTLEQIRSAVPEALCVVLSTAWSDMIAWDRVQSQVWRIFNSEKLARLLVFSLELRPREKYKMEIISLSSRINNHGTHIRLRIFVPTHHLEAETLMIFKDKTGIWTWSAKRISSRFANWKDGLT